MENQAAEEKGLLAGEVMIGIGTHPEEIFLADILAKIVEELPNVNVKILSGNYEDFIEGLFSKKLISLLVRKACWRLNQIMESPILSRIVQS